LLKVDITLLAHLCNGASVGMLHCKVCTVLMDFQILPSVSNGDATNGVVRSLLLTEANKVHIHRRTYLQEKSSLPLISKLELPNVSIS